MKKFDWDQTFVSGVWLWLCHIFCCDKDSWAVFEFEKKNVWLLDTILFSQKSISILLNCLVTKNSSANKVHTNKVCAILLA